MAKILIVDDEIGIRELLSEILRDEGHDVLLAENAGTARNIRNELCPDLVLLDIWMPDSDGISLLKEWSANGQLKMPVIMMSGHGTIDSAVEATRIGALDFLEKPIALQKLLASVKRGLAHRAMPSAPHHPTLAALTRSLALRDLRRRLSQLSEGSRSLLLKVGAGSLAELAARSVQNNSGAWLDLSAQPGQLDGDQLTALAGGTVFVPELLRLSRAQRVNLNFLLDRLDRYKLHLVLATEHGRETFLAEGWDPTLVERLFETSLPLPGLAEIKDDIPELAGHPQHLVVVDLGVAPDGRAERAALRPFHLDRRDREEQRSRKIALAADARLRDRFLDNHVRQPLGQFGRGERLDLHEIDRAGHRRLQAVGGEAGDGTDAGFAG